MASEPQAREQLFLHRRIWDEKPVLRHIYNGEFFARFVAQRKTDGFSIEVGAGPGLFKQFFPSVIATDLISCPWLDTVGDAQQLPFRSASVANIFGLDMLHHLAAPKELLREASRILVPGGRLILIEPWITPFSWIIFRFFHQERCDLSDTRWALPDSQQTAKKPAFDGNQAIPYLLFGPRQCWNTLRDLPQLQLVTREPFCLFAYLFSGGFNHRSLLPQFLYPLVARFEKLTLPLWRRLAALRVLLVFEKISPPVPSA